jgi:Zn finger protein HypA/HybF involved in hydrogenase expression
MQKIPRLLTIIDQLLQKPTQPVSVNIAVGELIQFTDEEIRTHWLMHVANSPLVNVALNIRRIRAEQQCMVCFQKYHPLNQETACPHCKSVGAKIIAGEEFYLESTKEENE